MALARPVWWWLDTPLQPVAATDPFAKFEITRRLLRLRQSNPPLFAEGSYQPLAVEGPEAEAICAFARLHGDAGSRRGRAAPRCTGAPRRADPDCIALRHPALLVARVDGCGYRSTFRGQLRSVSPGGDAYGRSAATQVSRGPMLTAMSSTDPAFEARQRESRDLWRNLSRARPLDGCAPPEDHHDHDCRPA